MVDLIVLDRRLAEEDGLQLVNELRTRSNLPIIIITGEWREDVDRTCGERAAMIYTIIETARLNGLDPYAYLADLLGRIGAHPINRITELLPWNWRPAQPPAQAA